MRIAFKVAYVAAVVSLVGCSSLNPFGKPDRNAPTELTAFTQTLSVQTAWTASVGKAGAFAFAPVVAEGSVYAASVDGSIVRFDAATGRPVWQVDAGLALTAGVGSDGASIAVAGEKGAILVFDNAGKLRWRDQASSEILSVPAVGQGLVIVRSVDNQIVAFDAASGARRWIVRRSVPALTLRTASGILIAGTTAYIGLPGGRLLALSLSNGAVRWEAVVGDPRGATELERIADVSGTPVMLGREVCAVSYQGRVACFDVMSGALSWAKELSSDVSLGIDERFVFAADEYGVLNAFARGTGSSVWRNKQLANRGLSAPISFERAVVVGDKQGYIHFLSRENGAFLARVETDGSPIAAAPLVAGENVIFQTKAGTLVAFGIK